MKRILKTKRRELMKEKNQKEKVLREEFNKKKGEIKTEE